MSDFDEVFSQLRRGPWQDDPNNIPQQRGLADGQIESTGWLSNDSVTAEVIRANAVETNHLSANSVTASKILAGSIDTDHLAANAVTAAKIEANTITANEIAGNTITANEIAASAITADELAANSVITTKILAANVTSAKIELTISAKNFGANDGTTGAPGVFFDSDSNTGMLYSTALGAPTIVFGVNGALRTQITSAGLGQFGDVYPGTDDTYDSGSTSFRWSTVYRVSESAVSDRNRKMDIEDGALGLDFIRSLKPRTFRWKDTPDTQARETAKPGKVDTEEIRSLTERIQKARQAELRGANPAAVEEIVEQARERLSQIQETYEAPLREARAKRRPGRRRHYGLIAQEVREALGVAGVDPLDAGFWMEAPTGEQSLSYSELLAPVIKAVQEIAERLDRIEALVQG